MNNTSVDKSMRRISLSARKINQYRRGDDNNKETENNCFMRFFTIVSFLSVFQMFNHWEYETI